MFYGKNFFFFYYKGRNIYFCYFFVVAIVATTRGQLPSDTGGAFADWATSSSTAIRAGPDDLLSLGFNPNAASTAATAAAPAQWPPSARPINYGLAGPEMGMVGLRDFVVVAPAASFNHHHHHHHHHTQDPIMVNEQINGPSSAAAAATALGVGVIPLLTASPCLPPQNVEDTGKFSGMQLWQNQSSSHYLKKPASLLDNNPSMMAGDGGGMGGGSGGSGSSSGATCQDCGNQAKKDCTHRRCRTCCKSRGLDCPTHVKSTWVPAARRRERQLMSAAATTAGAGSSGSTSGAKKPRLVTSQTTTTSHTSTSNTTPPRSFDTSSSHQDVGFKETLPGQVRAPAVFKCVRVTAVEGGEDEYAYQAVVKIGGHVFKGFLYDQGVEGRDGFPNISELHLGGGGRNAGSSSSPVLDPSDVYAATGGGFLGGGLGYGFLQDVLQVTCENRDCRCGNRVWLLTIRYSVRCCKFIRILSSYASLLTNADQNKAAGMLLRVLKSSCELLCHSIFIYLLVFMYRICIRKLINGMFDPFLPLKVALHCRFSGFVL
ncbi:protein LATERAL ROOT PRIMORDIUM 1-like isoform X1 [Gossypium arboreum]|uniref:protein LATERAL ROOT PRIMORDIUM 1-like isoform X1 n=1 Tax=Gossypium arboreum TaxID=29729 RepID=UPI0008192D27|nr:protein LATERAL ROOT PRIMORDIUM 1-like isoform X1 [Gossypium arboreum]